MSKKKVNYNMTPMESVREELETTEKNRGISIFATVGGALVTTVAACTAFAFGAEAPIGALIAGTGAVISAGGTAFAAYSGFSNQKKAKELQIDEAKLEAKSSTKKETLDMIEGKAIGAIEDQSNENIKNGGISIVGAIVSGGLALNCPNIFKIGVEEVSKGTGVAAAVVGITALASMYGLSKYIDGKAHNRVLKRKTNRYNFI